MVCHICGAELICCTEKFVFYINEVEKNITAEAWKCPNCSEVIFTANEVKNIEKKLMRYKNDQD